MDPELKAKYDSLPEDTRKALESSELPKKIQDIGRRHGLHIDQIGALEEEVGGVILGTIRADDFVDALEEALDIDMNKAMAIAVDVNVEIFQSIRSSLMEQSNSQKAEASLARSKEITETPDRESILSEIENPTPTVHPISAADQTIPGPAAPREVVTDLVANKLTGTVMIPSQKMQVPAQIPPVPPKSAVPQPPTPPKPQSYSADPYREPLM